jgi:gliding motility-associated-like protein
MRYNSTRRAIQVYFFGAILGIMVASPLRAQCYNEDFEEGTTARWFGFTGTINFRGVVRTDDPGFVDGRHTVTRGTGIDPVALSCGIDLTEVESSGLHSLRLGNVQTGAQAERITQTFTVEAGREFFLYKYAVVLEDPSHQNHQQPRFEVRVYDESGDLIPCGSYSVRAGPNAADDGFILCESPVNPDYPAYTRKYWVKDWTVAGADLSGYVGRQVTIEFVTADCSLGGHAGYAYVEASCKSLDVAVDGLCPGVDTTTLTITEGFESYLWYNGETGNSIEVADLQYGDTVSVTVNSFTGCSTTITKVLGPVDTARLDPPLNMEVCRGNGAVVMVSGENVGNYYWPELDTTGNSVVVFPDTVTTLRVEAFDLNGCPTGLRDSLTLTLRGFDLDTITRAVSCQGLNDGRLEVIPVGGVTPFHYEWSTGDSVSSLDSLLPGTYTVTVSDEGGDGCQRELTLELAEPGSLKVESGSLESACQANDGVAWVEISGGTGDYTLEWDTGETSDTILNIGAGTYSVTITEIGGQGCVQREEITVIEPPIFITTQVLDARCVPNDGSALALPEGGSSPNYSYRWGPTNETTPGIENLVAGTYWVEVRDENGCFATDTIIVRPPPEPLVISPVSEGALCSFSDGRAEVETQGGLPPYRFSWSSGGEEPSAENLSPGVYTVTVIDANDCEVTGDTEVEPPPPLLDIDLVLEDALCSFEDGMGTVSISGGVGPYQIEWSGSTATATVVDSLAVGEHFVTVTDGNGCSLQDSGEVGPPPPGPTFDYSSTGESYSLQNGRAILEVFGGVPPFTFTWLNGQQQGSLALGLSAGVSEILVTDGNGCQYLTEVAVPEIPPVRIYNTFTPNGDGVNDFWEIDRIQLYPNSTVEIYNRWGNLVFSSQGYSTPWDGQGRGVQYPADTYYYVVDLKIGIAPLVGYVDLIR